MDLRKGGAGDGAQGRGRPGGPSAFPALAGEQLEIGGEWFEAAALLALFIKRSLSLLGGAMRPEKADFFMFTLERVDRQALEMVERIALLLSLPPERVSCQSRAESFFFYNISQPEELWRHSCLICDFGGERLKTLLLEVNRHTRPATVTVAQEEHPELERQDDREEMDEAFLSIFRSVSDGRIIDTVYLIGDGFAGEWYPKTLAVMCRNRRVFQGITSTARGPATAERQNGPAEASPDGNMYIWAAIC